MKQKRRNHSAEFKARIALEALKGVKTVQQIAAENNLHPVQVTQWKGQVQESAAGKFGVRQHILAVAVTLLEHSYVWAPRA